MTRSAITSSILITLFTPLTFAAEVIPPPALEETTPVIAAPAQAQNAPAALPRAEDDSRNIPEPEVRIIRKKDTVIEEYRVNGNVRFIKVTPSSGPAYYLVDTDGDGVLETRENDLDNPPINRWILLEW